MVNWVNNKLGIGILERESRLFIYKFLVIQLTIAFSIGISHLFIILFILDSLTPLEIGFLFAVNFGISAIIDYPTGALGDLIGHKFVLILAYIFHSISIIILLVANSFLIFLIYISLSAFASSQESGALESWFDNQYRSQIEHRDPDRLIYKTFKARNLLLITIISGLSFIMGGLLAAISRIFLFQVYLILTIINLLLIILLLNTPSRQETKINFVSYWNQLKDGVHFVTSKNSILFYYVGSAIIFSANNSLWATFFLFPI